MREGPNPYPLANQLQAGLDKLRAAASRGAVSSREIFTLTDPLMDLVFRAAQADAALSSRPCPTRDEVAASAHLRERLMASWTDFLDANPDDLTSPEDMPNHALMTCDQFVQYATAAVDKSA